MSNIVLVSGGFDPIHSGHIYLIENAAKYGDVVVLLNSDKWLRMKKGREFLPFSEGKIIMNSLKNVINVIDFNDNNKTVIDGIKKAMDAYPGSKFFFANGGDRDNKNTPETDFCNANNIKTLWGIGGKNKSNSSSWILKNWNENKTKDTTS